MNRWWSTRIRVAVYGCALLFAQAATAGPMHVESAHKSRRPAVGSVDGSGGANPCLAQVNPPSKHSRNHRTGVAGGADGGATGSSPSGHARSKGNHGKIGDSSGSGGAPLSGGGSDCNGPIVSGGDGGHSTDGTGAQDGGSGSAAGGTGIANGGIGLYTDGTATSNGGSNSGSSGDPLGGTGSGPGNNPLMDGFLMPGDPPVSTDEWELDYSNGDLGGVFGRDGGTDILSSPGDQVPFNVAGGNSTRTDTVERPTNGVPEPSIVTLLGAGLVALGLRRRKKIGH